MNPTNNNSNSTPPEFSNSNNQQSKMDDGKTVSIIGLILAFTGLHLIGLILSVIGFKKAKKANSSTGLPMAGIIINAVFWLISTILFIVFIPKFNSFWKDVNNTSNLETSSVEESKIDEPKKEIDSIIVDDVYNYDKVCQNSYKVSNATPYQTGSTNKVVAFYNASQNDENYSKLYVDKDSWSVSSDAPQEAQLIVCMDFASSVPTGEICKYESDGSQKEIPLHNAVYDVKIYEATTYNKLGETSITTSGLDCPSFVTYDPSDPKVFQKPEISDVEGFVTKYAN